LHHAELPLHSRSKNPENIFWRERKFREFFFSD